MLYYPLLRTKKGELNALSTLKHSSIPHVRPILQIPPPELDMAGIPTAPSGEFVTKIANTVQPILAYNSPFTCFLDISPAGLNHDLITDLLFSIAKVGGTPHPVFKLTGSESYAQLYKKLIGNPKEAIIRITLNEMSSSLMKAVRTALEAYQLEASKTLILLDMGDISDQNLPITLYEGATVGAINQLLRLQVAGVILASGALPMDIQSLPKWKLVPSVRREIDVFRNVRAGAEYNVQFSDYATGNIIKEPTPSRQGSPKIRYTFPNEYGIVKGEKTGRTPNTMAEQFHRLSQFIVKRPDYSGPAFSWGDEFIYQASKEGSHPRGNATTWVAVNTSHHIELVVSMLPAMSDDF
ncbi:beta family protein [Hymenobacter sp. IS2118]|uniref:beta family protein n=1 Tax=Hymenobacter sp. IS2118 TaxID=1505605 RepID=UPI0009076CD8|nr:hypothetical protein [Hymenobacter sp. IS2118]